MSEGVGEKGDWAVYDLATGVIRVVVTCRQEQLAMQVRDGESALPCEPQMSTRFNRVIDAEIVAAE